MKFTKMHGCGNDYVYINGFEEHIPAEKKPDVVRFVSDRHCGIGGDGAIFINPSEIADFEMEMWNADGTRAEMCGNGIRCVGKYVYDHKLTDKKEISVVSMGAIKYLSLNVEDGLVRSVKVDMGNPIFNEKLVPVDINAVEKSAVSNIILNSDIAKIDEADRTVIKVSLKGKGREFTYTCVSMGNPHAITYVDDVYETDVHGIGAEIETHSFFPKRTNVEYIHVVDRTHVDMRVWERGTGETMACGTGACASVVSSIINGLTDNTVIVKLLGGELTINWEGLGNHVYMTGPATEVFSGEIDI